MTTPDRAYARIARITPVTSWRVAQPQTLTARKDRTSASLLTEARHADLKARVKYLPPDVLGQELRLLASSVAINAAAWQVHLQAHGERNVIDDTA